MTVFYDNFKKYRQYLAFSFEIIRAYAHSNLKKQAVF
jgi:hypothetical protein